jgi:hypothetical protein
VRSGLALPTESIARVDLLLGHATMLTADRWDDTTGLIHEAMAISLLLSSAHPTRRPVGVPGLGSMGAATCVDSARREVESWDLALAEILPDLARLRVLLADLTRILTVDSDLAD